MKKLLFLLLLFVPFWGFSQFEAGDYSNADTAKIKGESLIYPAPATGEHYYKGARNPSDSLDVVNLRFLFQRLAELDSLGLLVSDMVSGSQTVNTGETQIYFPSQFDTGTVVVVPYVRRVSDDAVIDYSINDVDSMGFDIVVWEDNIKVSYVASNRATSNFSKLTAYVNDSSFIKQAIRSYLGDSTNYVWFKDTVANTDFTSRLRHTNDLAKKQNLLVNSAGLATELSDETGSTGGGLSVFNKLPTFQSGINVNGITTSTNNSFAEGAGSFVASGQNPTIFQKTQRPGGAYASSISTGSAENTTTTLTAKILDYGAFGSMQSGTTPPTIIYSYFAVGSSSAYNNTNLRLYNNTNKVVSIDGHLGVGTTAPTARLHVSASGSTSNIAIFQNDINTTLDSTVNITKLGGIEASNSIRTGTATNYLLMSAEAGGNGVINVAAGDTVKLGGTTNYTGIEPDGTIVFRGNSTVWDDVNTGVAAAKLPAANYPAWTAFTANTNAYTFALNDYADLSTIEIPHGYKEGSNLEVHCHIATNGTNNATARKVKYIVYYTYCVPDNGSYQFSAEASLKAELTIPANQADKSGYYISIGTITGTGLKIGTQLKLRFKRIASTGTEPINDPFVGQVGIHYEKDTEGSRTISTK